MVVRKTTAILVRRSCGTEPLTALGGGKTDLTEYAHPAGEVPEGEDGSHVLRLPQTVPWAFGGPCTRSQNANDHKIMLKLSARLF